MTRYLKLIILSLVLALPATAQEKPHPCTVNPSLDDCITLAKSQEQEGATTLKEAIITNAPVITPRLNQAMDKVGEWVEAAEGLATQQVPLLVKEIIYFEIASNSFYVLLGIIGVLWGVFAWRFSYNNAVNRLAAIDAHTELVRKLSQSKRGWKGDTQDGIFSFTHYMIPISGLSSGFIGLCLILTNFMDIVKPILAPRLFLIEYFNNLVR